MNFTGEFFVPGKVEKRIEQDHLARYEFAKKAVRNRTILDIACGVGYGAEILKGLYSSYLGVDINKELIDFARDTYQIESANYTQGNVIKFGGKETFDVIICFETIEHVSEYHDALQNLYKNLKIGGNLIISSPNRELTSPDAKSITDKPLNPYHSQEFLPQELTQELVDVGFCKKKIHIYGQRQAIKFKISLFKKIYKYFFNPLYKSSPKVKVVKNRIPRYFILVAKK